MTSFPGMRHGMILLCLAVAGCGKEEPIEVLEVPKAQPPAHHGKPDHGHGGEAPGAQEIFYDLPEGWVDRGSKGIRKATLTVSKDGVEAEISVIPLAPMAGNIGMNVERWCRQVGASMPEAKDIRERSISGGTATLVDLQGEGGRILGAIIPREDACWFLKMGPGEPDAVEPFVNDFEAVVDSVRFGEGEGEDGGR